MMINPRSNRIAKFLGARHWSGKPWASDKSEKCSRCGWPICDSIDQGCTANNCSRHHIERTPDPEVSSAATHFSVAVTITLKKGATFTFNLCDREKDLSANEVYKKWVEIAEGPYPDKILIPGGSLIGSEISAMQVYHVGPVICFF